MKLTATTESCDPRLMDWDSEFWGLRVGRASSPTGLSEWAAENTVGMVCLLIDADDPGAAREAEERGFRFTDVRVTLSRRPEYSYSDGVKEHTAGDLDKLVKIARESHRITRFYADPGFPEDRCDDLYETWIRQSCGGWADEVYVAGESCGYVTVHVDDRVASIGLIAVEQGVRNQGMGRELVRRAISHALLRQCERIDVVTQGRNIAALRLFEKCGFKIVNTSLWMHKWYT